MKILYSPPPVLCVVVEELEDDLLLVEPVDGDEDERFQISLSDPYLTIDPTDDEIGGIA